ncbi:MAG: lipase family protein [Kiloniellales bacterium]|nr:lipase family protein [Kiloniellales bacterium]
MSQTIAACPIEQVHVDPDVTLDSLVASISAYDDFSERHVVEPEGYEFVDRFTGCVKLLLEAAQEDRSGLYAYPEERFGLIFRSTAVAGTYLVAFRGTDSIWDIIKDLYIRTVPFKPYDASGFSKNVRVGAGFNGIYADRCGSMAASMQVQLFTKLAALDPAPKKVLVTGHSLGGALASLFALDLAASRSDLQVASTTFASPRVGDDNWQAAYDKTFGLETATYRVANYYDWVPSLPPEWLYSDPPEGFFNYRHVGQQFLVAFRFKRGEKVGKVTRLKARHSSANYQSVLSKAVYEDPQVWVHGFEDAVTGFPMVSECPPSTRVPSWTESVRQEEEPASAAAE